MPFSLALDVLVAILLVITICYAMILNRKLSSFRREKAKLEKLAESFGEATARAGESIGKLKNTATDLQNSIDKAQSLRDDLVFLIDRGGSSADRLEEIVRESRKDIDPYSGTLAHSTANSTTNEMPDETPINIMSKIDNTPKNDEDADKLRSEAELELLKALKAAR